METSMRRLAMSIGAAALLAAAAAFVPTPGHAAIGAGAAALEGDPSRPRSSPSPRAQARAPMAVPNDVPAERRTHQKVSATLQPGSAPGSSVANFLMPAKLP